MPSMHDMIDELNDIECPSYPPVDSGCNNLGGYGNNFGSYGNNFGCGFGSWIWILLILFYAGQGGNSGYGGNSGCCCTKNNINCCCGNSGKKGLFGGLGNCGGGYLFLLVILFLCNGNFGCGNSGYGNLGCGNYGYGNNVSSCAGLI